VQSDDAVPGREREAVAQDVAHGERGRSPGRQHACPPDERNVPVEADDGEPGSLGDLARQMTVPGPHVDDARSVRREREDEGTEGADLGALARRLASPCRSHLRAGERR
jgi:hypothetical protein